MREDLAALDVEALALLTNRGLTRRAQKMLDRALGPELAESDDGTVTGTFPDGVVTTWPDGLGLDEADCSCGAQKACRHRLAVALAYEGPEEGAVDASWSPATISDDQLKSQFGARTMTNARTRRKRGVVAEVIRGDQPRVHLANGTVRFPVPNALHLAHCDALGAERNVMIVLAVWAFRRSDELGEAHQVVVGESEELDLSPAKAVRELVDTVLTLGVAELPGTAAGTLSKARTAAEAKGWRWVVDAVTDLETQIAAWRGRSQRYTAVRMATLVGELEARCRTAESGTPPSAGWFLGRGVASEAQLDHLTLVGLGASLRLVDQELELEVFLLDQDAGVTLVLQRTLEQDGGSRSLARRTVGGNRLRLGDLASGVLTTKGAFRRANRLLRLGSERGGRRHDLKAGAGAWTHLPSPIRVTSLDELRDQWSRRPPHAIRPRVLADDIRVLPIDHMEFVHWQPGEQELVAAFVLPSGDQGQVRLEHDPAWPGACGVLERALNDNPHHIAGQVWLDGGTIMIRPTAVASQMGLTVPALMHDGSESVNAVTGAAQRYVDPVRAALELARSALADRAHRGLQMSPPPTKAAAQLNALGMTLLAERLRDSDSPQGWASAWISVDVALESL
jgi:hypothetical protein